MESNTPSQPGGAKMERPRLPGRLTGERLGNKVQLAQALLRSGASQSRAAKDLGISRCSVGAIAQRMGQASLADPSGTSPLATNIPAVTPGVQQEFDAYVKGDLQRIEKLTLGTITQSKADKASLRNLAFSADKILGRLEVVEARAGSAHLLGAVSQQYGIEPSHSVSRLTLEQTLTIESQHTPQATK